LFIDAGFSEEAGSADGGSEMALALADFFNGVGFLGSDSLS